MPWSTNVAVTLQAGNTIINPSGDFVYSSAPAAGDLIASIAPAAGTDSFGNAYEQGITAYATIAGNSQAVQIGENAASAGTGIGFFIDSLSSPPSASPTVGGQASGAAGCFAFIDSGKAAAGSHDAFVLVEDSTEQGAGKSQVELSADVIALLCTTVTFGGSVSGGLTVDTLTVTGTASINGSSNTGTAGLTDGTINGSSSTTGLPDGTVHGTSGGASAGTAHTHGPGTFAVGNGQHSHGSGTYAVANGQHNHAL